LVKRRGWQRLDSIARLLERDPRHARHDPGDHLIGGKDECLDKIAQYAKVGVTHFIFSLRWPILVEEEFQAFAEEVIPTVRRQ
jgi:alkanesulfonate monooxygenase SsuD/methylene tetrahydromethanopterin reductase-like flavin-dependent oxidoreductase (luciferase family)